MDSMLRTSQGAASFCDFSDEAPGVGPSEAHVAQQALLGIIAVVEGYARTCVFKTADTLRCSASA